MIAGEPSGDLLGAGLVREIRRFYPEARFYGIAGPAMLAEGVSSWVPMERLSIMGLVEVVRHLPEILKIRRHVVRRFEALQPDVLIGIDSPDFNLGVERRLRARGIPTVQYVSPTIWAWRAGRIQGIGKSADLVLCLLPFEPEIYAAHGISALFVGHPMADHMPLDSDPQASRAALGISQFAGGREVIALLPGSRMGEVERLGGDFAAAAALLAMQNPELRFIGAMSSAPIRACFAAQLASRAPGVAVELIDGRSREVMAAADLVILASGTATLEAALLKRPMIVAYRVSAITARIFKTFRLMKSPYIALANLMAGEAVVPELIQDAATPERIAAEAQALLNDPARRAQIAARFGELRKTLRQGADRRAAESVLALVRRLPEPIG